MYGQSTTGEKILAKPKGRSTCSLCGDVLISKCGTIKVWHWAHKGDVNCDSWGEGESDWHLGWKKKVDRCSCEIKMGNHFADIIVNDVVIELQNSSISPEIVREREDFYGDMIWLFNGHKFAKNLKLKERENYCAFIWKWFPKTLLECKKSIYMDMGDKIFHIRKINKVWIKSNNDWNIRGYTWKRGWGGWGKILTYEEFKKRFLIQHHLTSITTDYEENENVNKYRQINLKTI